MSVTISGSGQIIKQVISVTKTDTFSMSGSTFTDVTGLSVSITPTNASNKIMIFVNPVLGFGGDAITMTRLTRNGTAIAIGNAASNRVPSTFAYYSGASNSIYQNSGLGASYLDSPATTSAVTYTLQIKCENAGSVYVNRQGSDSDGTNVPRCVSTITVMEIAYA